MDTKNRRFYFVYLLLQLFLPLCVSLGYLTGRPFSLSVRWLFLIGLSSASIFLTKQLRKGEESYALIPLLPLSIGNALFLLLQGVLGGVAAVVCLGCGWMLLEKAPKGFWRGACYILSVLLTVGFLLILPVWFFVQAMSSEDTVWKLDSPDKHYTAIVTSVDQGALGGDTIVEVRDNRESIHILLGRFTDSISIWRGGWGEHEDLNLCWENEDTLEICGISYHVTGENATLIAEISHTLGAEITQGQVLEATDTHGGFHGDGTTFAAIQGTVTIPDTEYWHPLPADGKIAIAISQSPIPEVTNGWYYVHDRHRQSLDPADGTGIFSHGSRNYTLAVYDEEKRILYYYELDT